MINIFFKLLLSMLLGALIGIERGVKGKPAGFRTMILIAFGSTLLTIISLEMVKAGMTVLGDPSRIAANIITGIGFLGAGTIIKLRGTEVHGITTAATLWVTASVGMGVGVGLYVISSVSTIFIILVLTLLKKFEDIIERPNKRYLLHLKSTYPLQSSEILKKFKINEDDIKSYSQGKEDVVYYWNIEFSTKNFDRKSIIQRAYSLEEIKEFRIEEREEV